ncbi:MAG: hypothetical protein Q7T25_00735, partial [Sideroxyarcus sp.]|nr:hypothetical protein [Sideroxyarcus sp.]
GRKEWMLGHIFSSVCLASYDALRKEATEEGELVWDARLTTPNATTHWVLADADARDAGPMIFTPVHGLLQDAGQPPAGMAHRSWHARRLAEIQP